MNNNRLDGFGMAVPPDSELGKDALNGARKKAMDLLLKSDNFLLFGTDKEAACCSSCVSSNPKVIAMFIEMITKWIKNIVDMSKKHGPEDDKEELDNILSNLKTDLKKAMPGVDSDKIAKLVDKMDRDVAVMATAKVIVDQIKRDGSGKTVEKLVKAIHPEVPHTDEDVFNGLLANIKLCSDITGAMSGVISAIRKHKGE